jgi:alpha-galactosidase
MLVALAPWMPRYRKAIAAAKKRLAKGPLIKTKVTRGAARIKTRSLAELKRIEKQNPRAGH